MMIVPTLMVVLSYLLMTDASLCLCVSMCVLQRGVDLVDGAEADTSHLDEDEKVLKVRGKIQERHTLYKMAFKDRACR
jgi:hypothetical protein